MGVQKLKLRSRVELRVCGENDGELIEYFHIQLYLLIFFKKKVKYFFCIFFYINVKSSSVLKKTF
jgi:hypothetical protein